MSEEQSPYPNERSIKFFEEAISSHSQVTYIKQISEQYYEITRKSKSKVRIFLTDLYTVGYADYLDIKRKFPDINCIITISNWNGYTEQAKAKAKEQRIGIFVFNEFMGALYWSKVWEYAKKDSDGKPYFFG